jgi:hypothetical protein
MQNPAITVMAEEEPLAIGFEAVALYHGQAALAMLAVTFQGLRLTLPLLSPDAPPQRSTLSVISGHPGAGVRDAFEFVTRALTRGAYRVDRNLPDARLNPHAQISYSFSITAGAQTVQAALKPGVLPERFFELIAIGDTSAALRAEFSLLKRRIAAEVLAAEPQSLFALS